MNPRLLARVAIAICLVWGLVTAAVFLRTAMRLEDARAAAEAGALAESATPGAPLRRVAVRTLMAEGRLDAVVRTMTRHIGRDARRIGTEDRVLTHQRDLIRYVSVPIKDADQWDIVGAIVLRADWLRGTRYPLLFLFGASIVAAALAARTVRRNAFAVGGRHFAPGLAMAALSIGMGVVAVLTRLLIDQGVAVLPPVTAATRFDPLVIAPPDPMVVGLLMSAVLLTAIGLLALTGYLAWGARRLAERRESLAAWTFLAPSFAHLAVFTAGPLLFTLWLSLHQWDMLALDRPFRGLGNYRELIGDREFWNALRNTAIYSLYVPVTMGLALGAALLLNQPLRGVKLLRAIVFLPTIVSYVAIAMVWEWMYNAEYGLLNFALRSVGLAPVDWLGDPRTALLSVMIVSAWVQVGYQMVVYLAGLQGIPGHLYEAARLDGADGWQRFRRITLPLLRPVSLYLLITGLVWSFQVFALVYIMTEGGPLRSTDVLVYQIYREAFEFRRLGYASAMSWVLFVILVILTWLQWRTLNRRVDYAA
jgi:multiple sugar transport system permease protein